MLCVCESVFVCAIKCVNYGGSRFERAKELKLIFFISKVSKAFKNIIFIDLNNFLDEPFLFFSFS